MNNLKVKFTDFWKGFEPEKDIVFGKFFMEAHNLELSADPDILVYSVAGQEHKNPTYDNCIKICYSAENLKRHNLNPYKILNKGHYLISMERVDHPNYVRLPNIVRANFYGYNYDLAEDFTIPPKTKFCSFIQRNCSAQYRNSFVKKLSKYKRIDCLGPCLNNTKTKPLKRKMFTGNVEAIAPYKFNISFENSSSIGYCTEKIWWGFLAKTISIYWGDPTVDQDFHQGSFLNRHEYNSDEDFIEAIIELDSNDNAYHEMLTKSKLKDKSLIDLEKVKIFFFNILES